jgi:hypothetical protein
VGGGEGLACTSERFIHTKSIITHRKRGDSLLLQFTIHVTVVYICVIFSNMSFKIRVPGALLFYKGVSNRAPKTRRPVSTQAS